MRVVPLENEAVNECWIADRDRFSYEALNSGDRLTSPMIKQDGQWLTVDWTTALEYVANGLKQIKANHGADSLGLLASPHSTVEELSLAATLMRGLGSDNIDHRLRHADFTAHTGARYLGMPIAALSTLKHALVVGSRLRKDHPLFAQRIRQATRRGAKVDVIGSDREFHGGNDWALPVRHFLNASADQWGALLANVAVAVAAEKGVQAPVTGTADAAAKSIATNLCAGTDTAILLGNAAAHHVDASALLSLANWIASQTGCKVGYLTEAANTVGAQLVKAQPQTGGQNAAQMLSGSCKAVVLLGCEPAADSAAGAAAVAALQQADMVVSLNAFKTNLDVADVLLPISPFTETSGTFVNAAGLAQSFHAVVKPLGETRPAWKVLRVLCNLMGIPGTDFESSQDVLAATGLTVGQVSEAQLSNACDAPIEFKAIALDAAPSVAGIYQLDGLVRRAPALQHTVDAKQEVFA